MPCFFSNSSAPPPNLPHRGGGNVFPPPLVGGVRGGGGTDTLFKWNYTKTNFLYTNFFHQHLVHYFWICLAFGFLHYLSYQKSKGILFPLLIIFYYTGIACYHFINYRFNQPLIADLRHSFLFNNLLGFFARLNHLRKNFFCNGTADGAFLNDFN